MLWKRTLASLAAFAVALLLALVTSGPDKQDTTPLLTLPQVDPAAVTKIEISAKDQSFTLAKNGDAWTIDPGGFQADADKVEAALKKASALKGGELVSKNASGHATYELGDGAANIALADANGDIWRLVLGKDTSDRRGQFVRKPDQDEVYRTEGRVSSSFPTTVEAWRSKTIFDLKKDEISAVEMLRGADALRLEKDGDQWRVAAPAELPERFVLDQTQVESLVGAFSNLRAAEFADNTTPEEVGLATPPLVITATTVSGPARLEMGDTADKQTFVKRGDGTQIYKIASYAHDRLDKSLDDLRDMRLMRYDVADATRLSITEGDRRLVFEKDGDWKMTESNGESVDGFVLDPKKVDTALRAIGNVKAVKEIGAESTPEMGFEAPLGLVVVTLADGTEKAVRFGGQRDDETIYARNDEGFVYAVKKTEPSGALKKLAFFKVGNAPAAQRQPNFNPEMLKNLPPEIRDQLMQQQRQQIMQRQIMDQLMKKKAAAESSDAPADE